MNEECKARKQQLNTHALKLSQYTFVNHKMIAQEMLAKSKLVEEKERLEAVRNKKLENMKLAAKVRLKV